MMALTRTISILRETINTLNTDIDSQRQEAQRLEKTLQDTQLALQRSVTEVSRINAVSSRTRSAKKVTGRARTIFTAIAQQQSQDGFYSRFGVKGIDPGHV